jgi:hypothetical protein
MQPLQRATCRASAADAGWRDPGTPSDFIDGGREAADLPGRPTLNLQPMFQEMEMKDRTILNARSLGCFSALLAAMVLAPQASAETQLNHGAGFCVKSGSDGTLSRKWQGVIANASSTQDLRVLCPLVRVAGQNTTGKVNVHVIDRSQSAGVRCSFYDQRGYGHTWSWSNWSTSLGSGPNNYRTFSFGPYNSQDKWSGFHHVHCILPPKDPTYGETILASYSSGDM